MHRTAKEWPLGSDIVPPGPRSVRQVVLDCLREAIVTGVLKPGQRLSERQLSEHFGFSTTPIKEALRMLQAEGWVVSAPRKGTYVSEMAAIRVEEIFEIRASLEGLACRMAARKITAEQIKEIEDLVSAMDELTRLGDVERLTRANSRFHELVTEASDNPYLVQLVTGLRVYSFAQRRKALSIPGEREEGLSEHRAIASALRRGDGERAEQLMKAHIMRSLMSVRGWGRDA